MTYSNDHSPNWGLTRVDWSEVKGFLRGQDCTSVTVSFRGPTRPYDEVSSAVEPVSFDGESEAPRK